MEFIPTAVNSRAPGSDAEADVWEALKDAFGGDDRGVAYYKFPVVDKTGTEYDREPDFVLLHQDLGLVVIECKGYRISHIEAIEGQVWRLQGTSQSRATPHPQARDQAFRLRSFLAERPELTDSQGRCTVPCHVFVALPNITRAEWEGRGFHDLPSTPRVLTFEDLSPTALRDRLTDTPGMPPLSADEYRTARAVLGGGSVIGEDDGGSVEIAAPTPTSDAVDRGALYARVEAKLPELDRKQEEVGIQIPPGPQQVRGIAGSGKTVLMAMKAARMHSRHPEWDIAVTFMTKSLYQHLRTLIRRFYRRFAGGEPNWQKLRLLHAWGGRTVLDGLYYVLASTSSDHTFLSVSAATERFGRRDLPALLDACCGALLEADAVPVTFDAVLIDEAQDFEPNFYRMCRAALRDPKRLIWAYDEAQRLGALTAPSPTTIFGTAADGTPAVDLVGSYEGGIQKSQIMRKAYRSPREVLMAAHAFGMGLKRERGAVQAITTQDGWENIGYEVVEGDFRRIGEPVVIGRPAANSPHPLTDVEAAKPFVRFGAAGSKHAEMRTVASRVTRDITHHGMAPEQVMVILVGARTERAAEEPARALERALDAEITVNRVWEGDASVFKREGEVTLTRINRAKGNEAASVYVTGLESVDEVDGGEALVRRRNEAFVAMTRTRGWCRVSGVGDRPAFEEFEAILEDLDRSDPRLAFPAPDPQALETDLADEFTAFRLDEF